MDVGSSRGLSCKKLFLIFFHRLGVVFSIFTFIAFLQAVSDDSEYAFVPDVLIPFLGCLLIYCQARLIGLVVNCLIKR